METCTNCGFDYPLECIQDGICSDCREGLSCEDAPLITQIKGYSVGDAVDNFIDGLIDDYARANNL